MMHIDHLLLSYSLFSCLCLYMYKRNSQKEMKLMSFKGHFKINVTANLLGDQRTPCRFLNKRDVTINSGKSRFCPYTMGTTCKKLL